MRDLKLQQTLTSHDLHITGATISEGSILVADQLARFVVSFDLQRTVDRLEIALRIYDTDGKCAFASRLHDHGVLNVGFHNAFFYALLTLPAGSYAASFEFVESTVLDGNLVRRTLGLNNLFVAFELQQDLISAHSIDADLDVGYARLPLQSLVVEASAGLAFVATNASLEVVTPHFPWPLNRSQFSQEDLVGVLSRSLFSEFDFVSPMGIDLLTVFTPLSAKRIFACGRAPMSTQSGKIQATGVRSNGVNGCLIFGPYLPIMPGRYQVKFNGEVGAAGAPGLKLDLSAKRGSLCLGELLFPSLAGPLVITYEFEIPSPGYVDLEFRLWGNAADDVYVENIEITSLDEASAQKLNALAECLQPLLIAARRLDWMLQQAQLAMVYCPSLNWSPLILALCEQLPQQGLAWVLVVPDDLDTASLPLPEALLQTRVIKLSEALALPKRVNCSMVVTHSFGFEVEAKQLLQHFSKAKLQLYADGFTNHELKYDDENSHIGQYGNQEGVYFFDNFPEHRVKYDCVARLVDSGVLFKYWFNLSEKLVPEFVDLENDLKDYVVLYLRYWGTGIYENFSTENIVNALVATLNDQKFGKSVVVVKSDPRIKPEIYQAVMSALLASGFNSLKFDDYLNLFSINGIKNMLPAEVFFAKGLLCQANAHFVLDSSLGYSIALNPVIRRPTKVILGVTQGQIDEWDPCEGTKWVKYQSYAFVNMIITSNCVNEVLQIGSSKVMPQVLQLI